MLATWHVVNPNYLQSWSKLEELSSVSLLGESPWLEAMNLKCTDPGLGLPKKENIYLHIIIMIMYAICECRKKQPYSQTIIMIKFHRKFLFQADITYLVFNRKWGWNRHNWKMNRMIIKNHCPDNIFSKSYVYYALTMV